MSTDLGSAVVGIGMDLTGLNAGLSAVKNLFGGGLTSIVAGGLLGIGAAAIGVGIKSLMMAGDFQQATTTLVTGAGEQQKNIEMVRQGILKMATDTGTSTKQLVDGMYMIESAGYHGADGLKVLKVAAEGAKVGNADLGVTADAVTTILTDYHMNADQAAQAMNGLVATVAGGKTHMQDLARSLSGILPTASAAHVGLKDVEAAMATMTGEGVPASNAATYLRQTILALEAPSSKAEKALASVGLSSQQVATEMQKSLPDALQMITQAVGKKFPEGSAQYVAAIKDISGGSKTMQGMLDLTGDHMKTFKDNVKNIGDAVSKGGKSINGWADVQKTFNFQMDKAKEVAETLGIKIGTVLLPIATKFMTWLLNNGVPILNRFADWFQNQGIPAIQRFAGWIQQNVVPVLMAMGQWIATQLVPVLERFGQWFLQSAVPALQAFGQVIMTQVVPAIAAFMQPTMDGLGWIKDHWKQIWDTLGPIVVGVFNVIKGIIQVAWAVISGIFKVAMDLIKGNWSGAWNDLKDMLHGVWDGITSIFKGGADEVIGIINGMINGLDSIGIDIGPVHIHPSIPTIPMLAAGGSVGPGMPFIAGERGPELITAGMNGASVTPLSGGGGNVHIYFDSTEFMHVVASRQDQYVRARLGPRSRAA